MKLFLNLNSFLKNFILLLQQIQTPSAISNCLWHRKAAPTGWQGNQPASRFAQGRDDLERRNVDKPVCRLYLLVSCMGGVFYWQKLWKSTFYFWSQFLPLPSCTLPSGMAVPAATSR